MAAQNTIPYVITDGLGHFTVDGDVKFLFTGGYLASDDGGGGPPPAGDEETMLTHHHYT